MGRQRTSRWQAMVLESIRTTLDPAAVGGAAIRHAIDLRPELFDSRPEAHSGALAASLRRSYDRFERAARAARRLAAPTPLVGRWSLVYDIYSPKLRRFIEVDERQHFSRPRLDAICAAQGALRPIYPSYFWKSVLHGLVETPAVDLDPPHRDEARAYRDEV